MAKLPGRACQCIETGDEQARCPFATGLVDHRRIFAPAPDGPYGTVSLAQRFVSRRSTAGSPSEAPKLITPAAKTFAPAGVS